MPRFAYSAMDRDGGTVKGDITAPDDVTAMDQLNRQGLTPITLDEGATADAWWHREVSLTGESKLLTKAEQGQFFDTIHTMLVSGFPLPRGLAFAAKQARSRKAVRVYNGLADDVSAGGTLASAMTDSAAFPERLIGLVRVGEQANRLPDIAQNISKMLRSETANTRQVRQALVYPAILLVMSVLVVLMLIFFLAPTLVPVFRSANADPPALLAALDAFGAFLRVQWVTSIAGAIGLGFASLLFARPLTRIVGRAFLSLPGFRSFGRARETLRLLQMLRLMIESGAQLPAALGAARDATSNPRWQDGLEEARAKVEAGDTLSVALRESGLPDEAALAFVEAGEEGDRMPEMLAQGAALLDTRTQDQLSQALRLITPALTLAIGLTVGLLIFTTIGAILDLNELAV